MVEKFSEISYQDIAQNNKDKDRDTYNFDEITNISPSGTLIDIGKIDENAIMGQIVIPSVNINLTLFKGISKNKLYAGVTTMKKDQEMGKGNFSIAGHYARSGVLFGDLDKIVTGDIVRLTDKKNIYEYTVFDKVIVEPTAVYMIEDVEAEKRGNAIISLMNCYYKNGKNTNKRLFILGDLTNVYDYDEELMEKIQKK